MNDCIGTAYVVLQKTHYIELNFCKQFKGDNKTVILRITE